MSDPRLSFGLGVAIGAGDAVLEALDGLRPVIRVGIDVDARAATALAALYSMLLRLFPHTVLEGDAILDANPWGATRLSELVEVLAAARPTPSRGPTRDFIVGAGAVVGGAQLWMGGDDWTADIGPSPRAIRGGRFGLGLQAAAAMVASEIAKVALGPLGMRHYSLRDGVVWNLADHRRRPAPDMPQHQTAALDVVFFGAGSVGSSAAGVLNCTDELHGHAVLVDSDTFDPTRNTYRYPTSLGTETGPKASWVRDLLVARGWTADDVVGSASDWVRSQPAPGFTGIVVSSVDRPDSRLQVADAMAATTLSVGVDGLALHIQREHVFDDFACPYCDFVSLEPPLGRIDSLAELLKLPQPRVAQLLVDGDTLSAADIAIVVDAGRIRAEASEELVGRRIEDLIRRTYAEISVPDVAGASTAVSATYVSWMGGILVAAELTKASIGLSMLDRRVDLDLSGIPLEGIRRRLRDTSGNCICASPQRWRWAVRLYGERWNSTTNSERNLRPEPQTGPPSTSAAGR
ncbi:MAG: hypothetical protein IVW52_19355 [Acidimicrobiales bacterium]|nr:hypothetical protein [Acidimicrobiales bacterium]